MSEKQQRSEEEDLSDITRDEIFAEWLAGSDIKQIAQARSLKIATVMRVLKVKQKSKISEGR